MKASIIDNFERLSVREKTIVLAMASVFAGFLIFLAIYLVSDTLSEMELIIQDSREQLSQLVTHQEEFLLNRARMEQMRRKLRQSHPPLTTFLDEQAKKLDIKIAEFKERTASTGDRKGKTRIKETAVEVEIFKVSLDKLMKLLLAIENSDHVFIIKKLYMKTRFDDRTLLDAHFTVSTFELDEEANSKGKRRRGRNG